MKKDKTPFDHRLAVAVDAELYQRLERLIGPYDTISNVIRGLLLQSIEQAEKNAKDQP